MMEIDTTINDIFTNLADVSEMVVFYSVSFVIGGNELSVPLILVWLFVGSVFFTVYLKFINIRAFGHAWCLLFRKDNSEKEGQIGSWQALAASLSGTVGLGNIAGVAVAISLGGPGAAFWMAVMGLISMGLKYAEVTMGVKYRHHRDPKKPQRISGGPMYYLRDWFANHDKALLGKILGGAFAVFCIGGSFGGGNMFQANQAYGQLVNITGGEAGFWADKGWLFGLILAVMTGVVIIGGIKSIARVSSRLVPLMGGIYFLAALVIIGMNIEALPAAFVTIFQSALTPEAGFGGLLGALLVGVQRAAFSNESGLGTAAIVYSTVRTDKPVEQGLIGMLGPFIDTVIICSLTALMIVITGVYQEGEGIEGVALTSRAMSGDLPWMSYILFLTVLLFAYSTLITWGYYGVKAVTFLFGENEKLSLAYKIFFCLLAVVGASSDLGNVIRFTDAMIFCMAIPNLIGLYLMAPEIRRDLKDYMQAIGTEKKKAQA